MPDYAPIFGTAAGDIAYSENQLTQARTLQSLGQLAQVPTDIALKQAQTGLVGAQAQEAQMKVRQMQILLNADQAYQADQMQAKARAQQELQAQGQLAQVKPALTGTSATQADIPPGGLMNASLADPLVSKANWMRDHGYPLMTYQQLLDDASRIQEHESVGKYRSAQAEWQQYKLQTDKQLDLANTAAAVGASPQAWLTAHSNSAVMAKLPPELAGLPYPTVKPYLDQIRDAGLGAAKVSTIAQQTAKAKLDAQVAAADAAKAGAYVSNMTVKTNVLKQDLDTVRKNDGDKSQSAKDSRDAHTQATDALTLGRQLVNNPYLPVVPDDPKLKVGATFTRKSDNAVLRMTGRNPATNLPQFEVMRPGPITRRGQRQVIDRSQGAEPPPMTESRDTGVSSDAND